MPAAGGGPPVARHACPSKTTGDGLKSAPPFHIAGGVWAAADLGQRLAPLSSPPRPSSRDSGTLLTHAARFTAKMLR